MMDLMIDELNDLRAYKALSIELVNRVGYDSVSHMVESLKGGSTRLYTKGALKVFSPNRLMELDPTYKAAKDLGFDLFSHNQVIYYVGSEAPTATSLIVGDFEVKRGVIK